MSPAPDRRNSLSLGLSAGLHVAVVLFLMVYASWASRTYEATNPVPLTVELLDPGSLDSEEIVTADPEGEAVTEQPDEQALTAPPIPDDANIVNERMASAEVVGAEPAEEPEAAPAQAAQQNLPAPDLTLDAQAQQTARFNPEGTAAADALSGTQTARDPGQEEAETPSTEQGNTASAEAAAEQAADPVEQLITATDSGFALPDNPAEGQSDAAGDAGNDSAEEPDNAATEDPGEDDINVTASDGAPEDAEKVTTAIPKRKPRALAEKFARRLAQEQQRRDEEKRAREEAERLASLAQRKPEPPKEDPPEETPPETALETPAQPSAEDSAQLDNLLATLPLDQQQAPSTAQQTQGRTASASLTSREASSIQTDIENNWFLPAGVDAVTAPVVRVQMELAPDGTVLAAQAMNRSRIAGDPVFAALARSAERAAYRASPLDVPDAPYETWKVMTITFDPEDILE